LVQNHLKFLVVCNQHKGVSKNRHHEQAKRFQLKFKTCELVDVIEEMGNHFAEDSNNILKLNSKELADIAVVDAVRVAERKGQEQNKQFVAEKMQGTKSITACLKRNKLPLFKTAPIRGQSKTKLTEKLLCTVFQTLHCLSDLCWEPRTILQKRKSGLPSITLTLWWSRLGKQGCPRQCLKKQCPRQ